MIAAQLNENSMSYIYDVTGTQSLIGYKKTNMTNAIVVVGDDNDIDNNKNNENDGNDDDNDDDNNLTPVHLGTKLLASSTLGFLDNE